MSGEPQPEQGAPPLRPRLTRPSEVKSWIANQQFLPSKVLGQNFLIDENILRIMLDAAALNPADRVLEVGPGLGILTEPLMDRTACVVAIEKDKRLAPYLETAYGTRQNFILVHGDALHTDYRNLIATHRLNKFVANLPYSVGSRILAECFMLANGFERLVVTVQLEVGQRLASAVGTSDYGLLGIWAQLDYEARVIKQISPSCFFPRPQVTSAIVQMDKKRNARAELKDPGLFDALIKHAFSRRRKQIGTILSGFHHDRCGTTGAAALAAAGIDSMRRPETLSPPEWARLSDFLSAS